jgi:hypothetical protein
MQTIRPISPSAQREALLELGTALESRMDDWLHHSCSSSLSNSLDVSDEESSLDSPGFTSANSDILLDELIRVNSPVQRVLPLFNDNHVNNNIPEQLLLLDITLSTPATLVIRLPHTQSIQSPVCLHYSTLLNGGLESIVIIEVWARDLGIFTLVDLKGQDFIGLVKISTDFLFASGRSKGVGEIEQVYPIVNPITHATRYYFIFNLFSGQVRVNLCVGSLDCLVDIQKQRQQAPSIDPIEKTKLNLSPVRRNCRDDECGKRISPVKPPPSVVVVEKPSPIAQPALQSPIPIFQQEEILQELPVNLPEPVNQITITIEQFHQSNRDLVQSPLVFTLLSNNSILPISLNQPISLSFTTPVTIKIDGIGESIVDTSVLDYLPSIYGWFNY